MRDADSYESRARNALDAVMEDSADQSELHAQFDAMSTDDLYALSMHADQVAKLARLEWLNRTARPAGD